MRRNGIAGVVVLVFSIALIASALPTLAAAASPNEVMLARPLVPTNHKLLDPFNYPGDPPLQPPHGPDFSEQQASSMLNSYLADEFPGDAQAQNAAKAVFKDATAKQKIPSPTLRATLASLKGTIAAPAIDYILHAKVNGHPKVTDLRWAPQSAFSESRLIAEVRNGRQSGQTFIQFNDQYRGESPFLFTWVMAHEPLHEDSFVANYEEAINQSLEALVYLHQLGLHPQLATSGDALSRVINTKVILRLNSGLGTKMGLYASNANRPLLPGSNDSHSSWSYFFTNGDTTTTSGNALLGKYLANIHTAGAPTCSHATFSKALLHCIDKQGNAGLSTSELVKAAKAMKLDTDVERDRSLSISYKSSAFKGTLSSPQKPCTRSQTVAVYKQKSGADPKVGSDQTDSSGAYSIHKRNANGSYYALAARSTLAGTGVCLEAKSSKKRVG